jgi:chromosome partitioning protein
MSTNSRRTEGSKETGLGWPRRPRIGRLLGWPFVSRGTPAPEVSRETPEDALHEPTASDAATPETEATAAAPERGAPTDPRAEADAAQALTTPDQAAPADPERDEIQPAVDDKPSSPSTDPNVPAGRSADDRPVDNGAPRAWMTIEPEVVRVPEATAAAAGPPNDHRDEEVVDSPAEPPNQAPAQVAFGSSSSAAVEPAPERSTDGAGESPTDVQDQPAATWQDGVSAESPEDTTAVKRIADGESATVPTTDHSADSDEPTNVTLTPTEDEALSMPRPRRARVDDPGSSASPMDDADEGVPGPVSRETRLKIEPLPAPAKARVIVVANQKGGVGKTTTSVNLAAALAMGGLNVVVIDLDPQGNASTALGIDHRQGIKGTYEVLIDGEDIERLLVDSPEAPNLRVLPATVDLAGAEIELVPMVAREGKLKRALRGYLAEHPTDYVLLDCPPSLGLLTINALVAAGEVLIPIQCEYYALEGVSQLMTTIELVMAELNEDLQLGTVLLTMFDGRTRLSSQVADEVRSYFAEQTLPAVIPRSVRISEAPSYGQTVLTYHPDSAGAVSYLQAARDIARRGAKENA